MPEIVSTRVGMATPVVVKITQAMVEAAVKAMDGHSDEEAFREAVRAAFTEPYTFARVKFV